MNPVSLANAELSVMELLWDHDGMTARQVQDLLYGASDRSQHGTVQRLLQRLEDKGFVRRERSSPRRLSLRASRARPTRAGN